MSDIHKALRELRERLQEYIDEVEHKLDVCNATGRAQIDHCRNAIYGPLGHIERIIDAATTVDMGKVVS